MSAPIQYAAIEAFKGGPEIDAYLERCRSILRVLGQLCATTLREAGCRLPRVDGAFYLFPDFTGVRAHLAARGVNDSQTLTEQLLEDTGVATLPGREFGRPRDELTLRLSYVNFDGAAALAAAAAGQIIDEAFVRRHCPATIEAIRRMADWAAAR